MLLDNHKATATTRTPSRTQQGYRRPRYLHAPNTKDHQPQPHTPPTRDISEAFWHDVTKPEGEAGCWYFAPNGHPERALGRKRFGTWANTTPWRLAYALHYGSLSDRQFVFHERCQNPNCVNPHHLSAATSPIGRPVKQHGRGSQMTGTITAPKSASTPTKQPVSRGKQRGKQANYPDWLGDTGPRPAVPTHPQQTQAKMLTPKQMNALWLRTGLGLFITTMGCVAVLMVMLSFWSPVTFPWAQPVALVYVLMVAILLVTEVFFRESFIR